MGSEEVLADFLTWGIVNYPARRYALVIWDHGSGWPGVAYDDSAGGDALTIPEIAGALERVRAQTGVDALDVIAFDACLMGQVEVLEAIARYGQVAVASAEIVPGDGFDYVAILDALTATPNMDAPALGRVMVDTYMYFYQNIDTDNPAFGLAAVDLGRVGQLTAALGELAAAVRANPDAVLSHIGDARNNALIYTDYYLTAADVELTAAVDLGDLMTRLARGTNVAPVARAAQAVADAVSEAVYHGGHSDTLVGSSGVAVYFPRALVDFEHYGANYETLTVEGGRWLGFLSAYYGTASDVIVQAPQLFISSLFSDVVNIYEPTQFAIDLTGRDIAQVGYVINYEIEEGRYVTLDRDAVVTWQEVEGEAVAVSSWKDGLNSFTFSWNGETPIVSDGVTETYALLVPTGPRLDVAVGQGRYAPAGVDEWISATLVFSIDTRQVTAVYGLSDAPGSPPFQLKPAPGDRFQLDWVFVNPDGSTSTQPGETLVFGEEPFYYDYAPAPSGAYQMGFLVEDIAGNMAYRWVDLDVSNEGLDASLRGYTDWDFGFNFLYPADWYAPTWDGEELVLYSSAREADISFTIYPITEVDTLLDAAAALHERWVADLRVVGKEETHVGDVPALVVRYEYESQTGPRRGVYAVFYHPLFGGAFAFDLDAASDQYGAAASALEYLLGSLQLFDPEAIPVTREWTVDINQVVGYALPVRSSWLPAEVGAGGWRIYRPPEDVQTFVALRADPGRGRDDQALADEWLAALSELGDRMDVTATNRREYYIGSQRWYAVDFTYTWARTNALTAGAFFVTNRGDLSYVYWIEAPAALYKDTYIDTFSVMIDGFAFLAGVEPAMLTQPVAAGPLLEVYTASGDGFRPRAVTPTALVTT